MYNMYKKYKQLIINKLIKNETMYKNNQTMYKSI